MSLGYLSYAEWLQMYNRKSEVQTGGVQFKKTERVQLVMLSSCFMGNGVLSKLKTKCQDISTSATTIVTHI